MQAAARAPQSSRTQDYLHEAVEYAKRRGRALAVCIKRYSGDRDRGVAVAEEVGYAHQIAKWLNCEIQVLTDATDVSVDMSARSVRAWLMERVGWLKDGDHGVFVASGHGKHGFLTGADNQRLNEMTDFEHVFATALGAKPKLYFYQHCEGSEAPWSPVERADADTRPREYEQLLGSRASRCTMRPS